MVDRPLIRGRVAQGSEKIPTVAVLGRGASAAYAYRACRYSGLEADVYGPETPVQKGAFWMHWMPPHLDYATGTGATTEKRHPGGTARPEQIKVIGEGSEDEYVYKQWGRRGIPSSFRAGDHNTNGYDPRKCLDLLWQGLDPAKVFPAKLDDAAIAKLARRYDVVLQTFPRLVNLGEQPTPVRIPIVWKRHKYVEQPGIINHRVVYNGVPGNIVRSSWLWGYESHELLATADPGYFDPWLNDGYGVEWRVDLHPDTKQGFSKPIAENVHFLGRYAAWSRKTLSYEAYGRTMEVLNEWGRQHR